MLKFCAKTQFPHSLERIACISPFSVRMRENTDQKTPSTDIFHAAWRITLLLSSSISLIQWMEHVAMKYIWKLESKTPTLDLNLILLILNIIVCYKKSKKYVAAEVSVLTLRKQRKNLIRTKELTLLEKKVTYLIIIYADL